MRPPARLQFHILRQKGTERAGSGQYNKHYEVGRISWPSPGPTYRALRVCKVFRQLSRAVFPLPSAGGDLPVQRLRHSPVQVSGHGPHLCGID
jgi:hypothetical protein